MKAVNKTIQVKAVANKWMSSNLNGERKVLSTSTPKYDKIEKLWLMDLIVKSHNNAKVGKLVINKNLQIMNHTKVGLLTKRLQTLTKMRVQSKKMKYEYKTNNVKFMFGDGVDAASKLENGSIDMLLTDPPYGISSPYTCEKQIPRRIRTTGADFIMPKGEFGDWDHGFSPEEWTDVVLPKIKGWAVIFCAQAQIGQYSTIMKKHKFNAIGTLVWHKTNPVPFNHKFKPLNAWEAAVVGKRPGTKFNGKSVHNVFTYKSPSPQHRIHPTQKPVLLMEKLIDLFSDKQGVILDPFAGSATTLVAAINMNRKCVGYENSEEYYRAAVDRLSKSILSYSE